MFSFLIALVGHLYSFLLYTVSLLMHAFEVVIRTMPYELFVASAAYAPREHLSTHCLYIKLCSCNMFASCCNISRRGSREHTKYMHVPIKCSTCGARGIHSYMYSTVKQTVPLQHDSCMYMYVAATRFNVSRVCSSSCGA